MSESELSEFGVGVIGDSLYINASADKVWNIITDFSHMYKISPQCYKMRILSLDKMLRPGVLTLNLNRRGKAWWATVALILTCEKNKELSFKILENGTIWKYVITEQGEGVVVTETRNSNERSRWHGKIADKVLVIFGGKEIFAQEIKEGITATLQKIKYYAQD